MFSGGCNIVPIGTRFQIRAMPLTHLLYRIHDRQLFGRGEILAHFIFGKFSGGNGWNVDNLHLDLGPFQNVLTRPEAPRRNAAGSRFVPAGRDSSLRMIAHQALRRRNAGSDELK
jgi:hypothetical protein